MKSKLLRMILPVFFLFPCLSFAQSESAALFLLIQPSTQATAMGGVSVASVSDDPVAMAFNPAHLGMLPGKPLFSVEVYPGTTDWLPSLASNISYDAKSFAFGFPFKSDGEPARYSVGFGYTRINLDLDEQVITGEDSPEPLGTFSSFERANVFTVAVGLDYFFKAAVGYSFKSIESNLGGIGAGSEFGAAKAKPTAHDLGVMISLPVFARFAPGFSFASGVLKPFLATTVGYSQSNIGGTVSYIDASQADPLTRVARIGIGINAGLVKDDWQVLAFNWSREAEDVLVRRDEFGNDIRYEKFLGDINFFDEIILGNEDGNSIQKTGWAYHFFDILSVRRGRYHDFQGKVEYETKGTGVSLRGIFKLFSNLSPGLRDSDQFDFLLRHIDVRFQTSEWQLGVGHPLFGTKFNSIRVSLF
ncbi:MAG: hypothetical protein ACE5I1_19225 [bacterium]